MADPSRYSVSHKLMLRVEMVAKLRTKLLTCCYRPGSDEEEGDSQMQYQNIPKPRPGSAALPRHETAEEVAVDDDNVLEYMNIPTKSALGAETVSATPQPVTFC